MTSEPTPSVGPATGPLPRRGLHLVGGPSFPGADRAIRQMAGRQVLVLNWRDVAHSQAGGAETYAHEIARRWVEAGARVTWVTARDRGQSATDVIDGVRVRRAGGALSVYGHVALRLTVDRLARRRRVDVVVDCQNGIPFFAPLFVRRDLPVVQVVHHVHQDQFATRFPAPVAALGRFLERRAARVYRGRRTVAVSTSTRQELRRRLKVRDVIEVVPNGTLPVPASAVATAATRAPRPTVALTTRMVVHKHVDRLLDAVAAAAPSIPGLAVDLVGDGPELEALRARSRELGLDGVVRFHGRLPDAERDAVTAAAWLTTSTSQGEGWGCTVLEAAAAGVPCLALRVPGIRDAVVDGRTGWLVDDVAAFADALPRVLAALADPVRAEGFAAACRRWAACFDWDRTAELMAGVVLSEIGSSPARNVRAARSDMTTLVRFVHDDPERVARAVRLTDELSVRRGEITAVLRGCDEVDAHHVVDRLGGRDARVRLAGRHELLGGPAAASDAVAAEIAGEVDPDPARVVPGVDAGALLEGPVGPDGPRGRAGSVAPETLIAEPLAPVHPAADVGGRR